MSGRESKKSYRLTFFCFIADDLRENIMPLELCLLESTVIENGGGRRIEENERERRGKKAFLKA